MLGSDRVVNDECPNDEESIMDGIWSHATDSFEFGCELSDG